MVKSLLLGALLGVASLGHARPTVNNLLFQMEQMEQMRLGVEEYNRNLPEEEYQAMARAVEESNKESAILACPRAILVFARGTFEPAGLNNLGSLVGGAFFSALRSAIPGIQGAGVNYSNDVFGYLTGYLGGTTPGSAIMAKQLNEKVAECPSIKIIAGGYR
jgi:Cutinase